MADIDPKKLEEYLLRNCGKVTRLPDGHDYQIVQGKPNEKGEPTFRLERVSRGDR